MPKKISRKLHWLKHVQEILDNCQKILSLTKGLNKEAVVANDDLCKIIERCIINIGEGAKYISEDIRTLYPNIKWDKVVGMRNLVIHVYWDIDYDKIWDAISNHIPKLIIVLKEILENNSKS